jgi:hypothetical protein
MRHIVFLLALVLLVTPGCRRHAESGGVGFEHKHAVEYTRAGDDLPATDASRIAVQTFRDLHALPPGFEYEENEPAAERRAVCAAPSWRRNAAACNPCPRAPS